MHVRVQASGPGAKIRNFLGGEFTALSELLLPAWPGIFLPGSELREISVNTPEVTLLVTHTTMLVLDLMISKQSFGEHL